MQPEGIPPSQKKQKSSDVASASLARGTLSGLTNMPMDVLFEIFVYLHPHDLLRIARVAKALRRLLLHRSASGVWRAARESAFPSIPHALPGLSEPSWIHLLFGTQCHFCGKVTPTVEWTIRVRVCRKCTSIHTSQSSLSLVEVESEPSSLSEDLLIEAIIPRRPGKKGIFTFLKRDYQAVAAKYAAIKSTEDRKSFIAEQRELISQINEHVARCKEWAKAKASDRTQQLKDIRKDRQAAIIEKLINLGYEEDIKRIEYPQNLEYRDEFTRAQPLTEKIWKNIQGPLEAYMNLSRTKRLARLAFSERSKPIVRLFQQYKNSHLPYNEIMPGPIDLCNVKQVKEILNSPSNAKIDESSFDNVVPHFDDFVRIWQNRVQLRLLHQAYRVEAKEDRELFLLGYDAEDKNNNFDAKLLKHFRKDIPTLLKQTVFVCDSCTPPRWTLIGTDTMFFERQSAQPLYYPEVLGHPCLTHNMSCEPPTQSTDSLKHLEHCERDRAAWNCRILSVEKSLGRIFKAIVTIAGQHPVSTGAREMDQLDLWFACMHPACVAWNYNKNYWAQAFNWRNAVIHHAEHHPEDPVDFEGMTSYELDFSRSRLRPLADIAVPPKDWLCAHCRDLPQEQPPASIDEVKEHLKSEHNIMSPELNQDYYKCFGAPLRPVYGKGALGESLEIFGDIRQIKVGMVFD
ncbi:hypothetical protein B0H11DRAFT_2084539 [Mycena galericulata]|nr:hypothetical protein B0H11DRAFT_2084539 [Mycena galericulata]